MHEKEAYQVLAVGAKMEGIMESFTRERCKEKYVPKKKKFLAL